MKHGKIGYVWKEISKTVFNIFLAEILRKLWHIEFVQCIVLPRTDGQSDGRTDGKKNQVIERAPLLKNL